MTSYKLKYAGFLIELMPIRDSGATAGVIQAPLSLHTPDTAPVFPSDRIRIFGNTLPANLGW